MSKRRKYGNLKTPQVVEITKYTGDVTTYQSFFQGCVIKGLAKSWQENEYRAFFLSLGLTDKEPLDRYADAFKRY